ncbi:MAG: hypothetical protein H8E36_10640 [Rhodospirillaceae bacterium]|nr:hypothetical protein [Rhodospirillaceae bacterium]MBL6930324.1 hypothetical protein [Rhodospirillales bacterium]
MKKRLLISLWILLFAFTAKPSMSTDLTGTRQIKLMSGAGEETSIGSITFEKKGDSYTYTFSLDDSKFAAHFLSMRPFKCLEGEVQYLCHLPYPYEKTHVISHGDFADLEHEFLFIHKKPTDYGINMWNGVYFVMSETESGLTGRLHELDMDILASPPEAGVMYPLLEAEKMEGEPSSHWLPFLKIE